MWQHGWRNPWTVAAIVALLCMHALLACTAVVGKNATIDEPSHAMQAFMVRWYGDYRVDPANPPLWMRWMALGLPRSMLKVNTAVPTWPMLLDHPGDGWQWFSPILYRTPGNDPDAFINRARLMMLPIALALGALMAWWAWRLAGPIAALAATTLWALDPNFLAHGPLVKNDVATALCLTAVALACWRVGQRLTIARLAILILWCAAAATTKFTGLLAGPILVALLLIRSLQRPSWPVLHTTIASMGRKLIVAGGVAALCALGTWGSIWAVYGFRFTSGPTPAESIDLPAVIRNTTRMEMLGRNPAHNPTPAEIVAQPPSMPDRLALWTANHRLFPQAYLAGFIYVRAYNQYRPGFLLGHVRTTGWWWYFPFAALVKTPITSLVAAVLAGLVFIVARRRPRRSTNSLDAWSIACLLVPLAILGITAMASRQNVGIRHVLTMGPPIFIIIGIAAARAANRWPRTTVAAGAILAIALATETLCAYPDFIPFFNIAAGGSRGGLRLLSDSNLDWGQDLRPLAAWRRQHPEGRLLLDYLGTADPSYYLDHDYIPLSLAMSAGADWPHESGYLAVSASHLQGLYVPPPIATMYRTLARTHSPVAVIGGSIYVFRLPLR